MLCCVVLYCVVLYGCEIAKLHTAFVKLLLPDGDLIGVVCDFVVVDRITGGDL